MLYFTAAEDETHAVGFRPLPTRGGGRHGVAHPVSSVETVATRSMYLEVRVDVLDPDSATGTDRPDNGALAAGEAIAVLADIDRQAGRRMKAADVVELAPSCDTGGMTALAAANFAYHFVTALAANAAAKRRGR